MVARTARKKKPTGSSPPNKGAQETGSSQPKSSISLRVSRASDLSDEAWFVLVFGDPGAGKTHLVSTAKKPIILLTERNGITTVRRANPDALVFIAEDMNDIRAFMKAAKGGEFAEEGIETIVMDSLTEIARMMIDEILDSRGRAEQGMTRDMWGLFTERFRLFMRTLRTLPLDVVATALASHQTDGEDGPIHVRPVCGTRNLANEVAQYFNAVGFVYKTEKPTDEEDETSRYRVAFDLARRFVTKSCHPIVGTVSGPFSDWQTLIHKPTTR